MASLKPNGRLITTDEGKSNLMSVIRGLHQAKVLKTMNAVLVLMVLLNFLLELCLGPCVYNISHKVNI